MSEPARHHAVFDSEIGPLALAWSERGLIGVQLPEATRAKTLERLARRARSRLAPPPRWVELAALRQAFERGFDNKKLMETDPDLANIRGDPRYAALVKEWLEKRGNGNKP